MKFKTFLHCFRIQELNKITKRRLKEVHFFKQRLLNNNGEDWSIVPVLDSNLEDDEDDKKSVSLLASKEKTKEEKTEDG